MAGRRTPLLNGGTHKQCAGCAQVLPLSMYHMAKTSANGRQSLCKACKYRSRSAATLNASKKHEHTLSSPDGMEKTCSKCLQLKPRSSFNRSEKGKLGLTPGCKTCETASRVAYEQKHRDLVLRRGREKGKKACAALTPSYIAANIGIPRSELTPELLDLKREAIITTRFSRSLRRAIKECLK